MNCVNTDRLFTYTHINFDSLSVNTTLCTSFSKHCLCPVHLSKLCFTSLAIKMLQKTVLKALLKSRQTVFLSFPLPTETVFLSLQATRLGQAQFASDNPCWLFPVTSWSFMWIDTASRRTCSLTFPGTEVRMTGLYSPASPSCLLGRWATISVFPVFVGSP